MKTVGVVRRLDDRKVIEIAEPFGVVCAIVPTTNPTSTASYKILICIKARCPIVISPHPSAVTMGCWGPWQTAAWWGGAGRPARPSPRASAMEARSLSDLRAVSACLEGS
jgi:hypothetical protein